MSNNSEIKINVRFEDYDGVVFKHFCPYCMEEIEKPVIYEESGVECDNCKKKIGLNWNTYINDIENFLSEKIRYSIKSQNAYGDEELLIEAVASVIEDVYNEDSSECYDVSCEVMDAVGDFEDEHDIAKEILELLDVPSFSSAAYEDYEEDDESDSYEDDDDEDSYNDEY